ncbi:hypothetical protein ACMFMG_009653 [Clarireedia jacksonii]
MSFFDRQGIPEALLGRRNEESSILDDVGKAASTGNSENTSYQSDGIRGERSELEIPKQDGDESNADDDPHVIIDDSDSDSNEANELEQWILWDRKSECDIDSELQAPIMYNNSDG